MDEIKTKKEWNEAWISAASIKDWPKMRKLLKDPKSVKEGWVDLNAKNRLGLNALGKIAFEMNRSLKQEECWLDEELRQWTKNGKTISQEHWETAFSVAWVMEGDGWKFWLDPKRRARYNIECTEKSKGFSARLNRSGLIMFGTIDKKMDERIREVLFNQERWGIGSEIIKSWDDGEAIMTNPEEQKIIDWITARQEYRMLGAQIQVNVGEIQGEVQKNEKRSKLRI